MSPQYLDNAKQQNNSGVNAPTLGLLTASEDPVAPDNLQRQRERHLAALISSLAQFQFVFAAHARHRSKWKSMFACGRNEEMHAKQTGGKQLRL